MTGGRYRDDICSVWAVSPAGSQDSGNYGGYSTRSVRGTDEDRYEGELRKSEAELNLETQAWVDLGILA